MSIPFCEIYYTLSKVRRRAVGSPCRCGSGVGIYNRSDKMSDDELRDALCDPYDLVYEIITGRA